MKMSATTRSDEAYQIGERGHPVRAYLDVAEIIRAAQASGADAVYPGYGFLSENPDLAQACADAGIAFIGPGASMLELAGNKARAIIAARAAGLPVLPSSEPASDVATLTAGAHEFGFPVFVKAVAGGGGRGMRRVDDAAALPEALALAMREAESAFGDPTVFVERAVVHPRHIEVQILADHTAAAGNPDGPVHWTTTTPSGTTHTGHLRLNGLPDNVFTVGVVCFAATAKPVSRVPRPRHTCRGMVGTFIATLTPRPGVRTISP
jgi:pyruvate carboxylase